MATNKTNTSMALDYRVLDWLNKKENKSEFINKMLISEMEGDKDVFNQIEKMGRQIIEIEQRRNEFLEEVEKTAIEGNLKERERSEIVLQEQKEDRYKILTKMKPVLLELIQVPKWKSFVNKYDKLSIQERFNICVKIQTTSVATARWSLVNDMFKLLDKEELLGEKELIIEEIEKMEETK